MIGAPGATLATQTANPVTAVAREVQTRTLVLDPVPARYIVYSGNTPLSEQKVIFLGFSGLSAGIKQLLQLLQCTPTSCSVCDTLTHMFRSLPGSLQQHTGHWSKTQQIHRGQVTLRIMSFYGKNTLARYQSSVI